MREPERLEELHERVAKRWYDVCCANAVSALLLSDVPVHFASSACRANSVGTSHSSYAETAVSRK